MLTVPFASLRSSMGLTIAVACAVLGFAAGVPEPDDLCCCSETGSRTFSDSDMSEQHNRAHNKRYAREFVHWWLGGALDFDRETFEKSHVDASKWMPNKNELKESMLVEPLLEAIRNGRARASVQLYSIEQFSTESPDRELIRVKGNVSVDISVANDIMRHYVGAYPIELDVFVVRINGNMRIESLRDLSSPTFASRIRSSF